MLLSVFTHISDYRHVCRVSHTSCYIEPFMFSCLNTNSSSEWSACRISHTPWFGWPFLLCYLITNSSSEWTVCCTSHTPSSGCPFLLCCLITNSSSEWTVCYVSHTPSSGCRFFCSSTSQTVNWTEPYALHRTHNCNLNLVWCIPHRNRFAPFWRFSYTTICDYGIAHSFVEGSLIVVSR